VKSWTKTAAALAILTLIALPASPALAQVPPAAPLPLPDPTTTLLCKGDNGDIQPMPYISLGTVMRKYAMRYNFHLSLQASPMTLIFSNPAESEYFISFEAMPYRDDNGHSGIALLSGHISLENTDQVIKGTGMCYFAAR
jgi:hypothetical protein